jgi:sarcosine oxidase subunit alpha
VLARLSGFLPVGFYYRAFYAPAGIWHRLWEPVFRRLTGLGTVTVGPVGHDHPYDKVHLHAEVLVIGGGEAGMAAALAAAEAGRDVLLVEAMPILGGALNFAREATDRAEALARRDRLIAAVTAHPGIAVMTGALANGWFADNWVPVIRDTRLHKVRAGEVVLAGGSIDQPAIFRGNDLPGVMTCAGAQRLIRLWGVRPGRRAVILTCDDAGHGAALDLIEAGCEVAALADTRPVPADTPLAAAVRERGVPVHHGACIAEARAARGWHVTDARIAAVGEDGRAGAEIARVACDLIAVSAGAMPAWQLPCQAGGRLALDDAGAGGFHIEGLPTGVRLAGALAGAGSGGLAPIVRHRRGKEFVDLDEDLTVADLENAVAEGYDGIELVKRFSTVGMGPSQGRHSALAAARVVAGATGRTVGETGVTTARPPVAPELLGVLGGRRFAPYRRTPMHDRHLEAGAQMMPAGAWSRPAFYGRPDAREAAIAREVMAVRRGVGLIDVSTLGGIELRGPDAAELLERLYTFAFARQPVGRCRYLLMTDEAGTIIDDGIACRSADDLFYVTATTGAADRVTRAMLWWNAQWRLDVDVANLTAALAGVNLAGPASREVLAPLTDLDLAPGAFPYLGFREGTVAGIPARVFRVGFVGELGYEIHVPSTMGEALWDALCAAGQGAGLVPFGVEAQRVLRLEKGHIIVGQDTDAMTTPQEAQMAWAVSRRKPFFVGERSLRIRDARPSARRLVGFALDPSGEDPRESNLVIKRGEMAGFVTSVCRSPTLGRVIGLAFAAREDAEPGCRLAIRLDSGRTAEAEVVALPFFDPDGARQEL